MASPHKTFPWGLHPLPKWIRNELDNRSKEYGINLEVSSTAPYSGPRTAWSRVFSNGISSQASQGLEGFVMGGTEGFDASYGFGDNVGDVTIGVDAWGNPHKVTSYGDFPHRPPPSIESVTTQFQGGTNSSFGALCRETTINWRCYSLNQLEYLTPYFLTPRMSVLVEWGWNNYDTVSLVDLSDVTVLYSIFLGDPDWTSYWVEQSSGNYDLAMGFIVDYGYSSNPAGGYDCFTTIRNANYLIEGQSYQNSKTTGTDPKDKKKTIQLKDFKEFVVDDMDNLAVKYSAAAAAADSKNKDDTKEVVFVTEGKIFRTGGTGWFENANALDKVWVRMDLIEDIINRFFAMEFIDKDGKATMPPTSATKLDISGVAICAHPAMKSVNKEILIPNKYAPRFITVGSGSKDESKKKHLFNETVGDATAASSQAGGPYFSLFPDIAEVIRENKLDSSYDNLHSIINPTGNSFPMFESYTGTNDIGEVKAGYWGYLQDLYISVEFFKELVGKNDTVLKLLEELAQHISKATCDVCQLKVVPHTIRNQAYTIMDTNFSVVNTVEEAAKLQRISIGSNSSAYLRSFNFDVKLAPEMSNQMVMQSASDKGNENLPTNAGTTTVDPKNMVISKYSLGDRMFQRAVIPKTATSNTGGAKAKGSKETPDGSATPEVKFKRMYSDAEDGPFFTFKKGKGKNAETFILAENDPTFINGILVDLRNTSSVYTNNGIMPGTTITIEFLGIAGITFLSQFTLDHVPNAYAYERAVWQVSDVKQNIENKLWTTSITAQARPLTILEK